MPEVNKEEIDTDDDAPVVEMPKTAEEHRQADARDEAEYEADRQRREGRPQRIIGARRRNAYSGGREGPSAPGDRDWERSRISASETRTRFARMREFSGGSRKRKASVPIRRNRSL